MKRVRVAAAVLMMCLTPLWAMAQGLEETEAIRGSLRYPNGVSEAETTCVLEYAYPQFAAQTDADERINAYFQSSALEITGKLFEKTGLMPEEGAGDAFGRIDCQIDYQLVRNDQRYVSVLMSAQSFAGNGVGESLSALTFARDGQYAGQPLSLSQALGMEPEAEGNAEGKASRAQELAYGLVWEIVRAEMENVDGDYLDGIDQEALYRAFDPETDFYMDEDGNLVFFIQAGILTGEVAGALRFPFAPEEMLIAAQEETLR